MTTHPLGRVAALLVKDGVVALVERRLPDELYYLFGRGRGNGRATRSGGGARGARGARAEVVHRGQVQYYYAVTTTGGTFGTGTGAEIGTIDPVHGSYLARWIPIDALRNLPVHPKSVADLVADFPRHGWPASAVRLADPGRERLR